MRFTYHPPERDDRFPWTTYAEDGRRLNPPRSFLINNAHEIVDSFSCGHFTGVYDPMIQKMVPWFKEAADIMHAWSDLVDWRDPKSYGHRTDLTNPIDDDLMGAFYAFGGHRLEAYQRLSFALPAPVSCTLFLPC